MHTQCTDRQMTEGWIDYSTELIVLIAVGMKPFLNLDVFIAIGLIFDALLMTCWSFLWASEWRRLTQTVVDGVRIL